METSEPENKQEPDMETSEPQDEKEPDMETTEPEDAQEPDTEASEPEEKKEGVPVFKRILLYAAMVIAVIFLLLGLAGLIGGWVINTPTTETVLAILEPIDNAMQGMEEAAVRTGAALSEISASLEDANQRVQTAGEELAETSILQEVISRIAGEDLQESVNQTRDNIRAVYETLGAIEEAVQAFNAIPFVDLEIPGEEEIASVQSGMEEIAVGVAELKEELQERREDRAENLVERVSAPINRLSARVEELQSKIAEVEARLSVAIERIDLLQSRVPVWIDIISIISSLFFAWFMVSQGAVIVLCWRALHPNQSTATSH